MNGEVIPLFSEKEVNPKDEEVVSDNRITYESENFGIIGDALIYPGLKIKINEILKVGDWCDTQHEREHSSCVEVIFEGGIMRTTLENLEEILGCSIVEEKKRATL